MPKTLELISFLSGWTARVHAAAILLPHRDRAPSRLAEAFAPGPRLPAPPGARLPVLYMPDGGIAEDVPMPEERHSTIYHPAAPKAFRALLAEKPARPDALVGQASATRSVAPPAIPRE